ncbi:hypothetical protein B0H34DRAFT_341343 [Crassisporium funariophilum]|nr:hypothetical protein B0H34DRAFT_341343 [Crassisporium funariophilum]
MEHSEPWHLTVIVLEGLRLMRAEKSWRPIVTVEIDDHHTHETVLGADGQNVNQKDVFKFDEATTSSTMEIKVWHRSQSKKKGKRRNLVASASHCLGELLRKQELEPNLIGTELEIRLQCRNVNTKSTSSRGRPQSKASLRIRLRAPPNVFRSRRDASESEEFEKGQEEYAAGCSGSSTGSSSSPSGPPSIDECEDIKPIEQPQTIRRRVRGYAINSDDEVFSSDGEPLPETKPIFSETASYSCIDSDDEDPYSDPSAIRLPHRHDGALTLSPTTREMSIGWIAESLLPRYTEKMEVPPQMTRVESALASFTTYSELKEANMDSHYERVFHRLQMEWTYIGGLLVALAAVNTAVFSISPDSMFTVDSYARSAIAASSIASGLGIACDAWFLLRYNWADLQTFIVRPTLLPSNYMTLLIDIPPRQQYRAKDVYDSYFFFALSARVPALCMFISALSLMGFLGLVAFEAWPQGVIVVCFVVGVVMSLQFLVFGAHWCAERVVKGGRAGGRGIVRVVRGVQKMTG